MWGNSPTSHSRPVPAPPGQQRETTAVSPGVNRNTLARPTFRDAEVGDHPAVGAAGGAMTIKGRALVRGTAVTGDAANAQGARPDRRGPHEDRGAMARRRRPAGHSRQRPQNPLHNTGQQIPTPQCITTLNISSQWPRRAPPPPERGCRRPCRASPRGARRSPAGTARYTGMQSATVTVSSTPGGGGDPAVDVLDLEPSPRRPDGAHVGAVDLVAQHDGGEPGHGGAEEAPAAHHLADRRLAPEA